MLINVPLAKKKREEEEEIFHFKILCERNDSSHVTLVPEGGEPKKAHIKVLIAANTSKISRKMQIFVFKKASQQINFSLSLTTCGG